MRRRRVNHGAAHAPHISHARDMLPTHIGGYCICTTRSLSHPLCQTNTCFLQTHHVEVEGVDGRDVTFHPPVDGHTLIGAIRRGIY